jgi:hypothetical protein
MRASHIKRVFPLLRDRQSSRLCMPFSAFQLFYQQLQDYSRHSRPDLQVEQISGFLVSNLHYLSIEGAISTESTHNDRFGTLNSALVYS